MPIKQHLVALQEAAEEETTVPPNVWLPPTINGKKTRAVVIQNPVSVHDQIVKIQQNGDPLGQLVALSLGQPVPTYLINEEGECKTVYETPTLAQRISITKWLGDRILPKVNVNVKKDLDDDWEANLRNAAAQTD